jgi:hypothetical protein
MIKYDQCKGCYSYKEYETGCLLIKYLHKYCPCQSCLIKPVCNSICEEYIKYKDIAYMEQENILPTGLICS